MSARMSRSVWRGRRARKRKFGQRAAALNRGADGAPEIDPAALARVQPPAQSHPEASRDRRQGIARGLVFEIGISRERGPPDFAPRSLAARVAPGSSASAPASLCVRARPRGSASLDAALRGGGLRRVRGAARYRRRRRARFAPALAMPWLAAARQAAAAVGGASGRARSARVRRDRRFASPRLCAGDPRSSVGPPRAARTREKAREQIVEDVRGRLRP